jgi:DNA-binding response OmpR family regulator
MTNSPISGPAATDKEPTGDRDPISEESPVQEQTPPRRLRVLLIEDELLQIRGLQRLLGLEGIQVDGVQRVEDAFTQMANQPAYDAIVTDLGLEGLSGRELVRRLRRPRLVVVTGDDRALGSVPQADVVLLKPYSCRQLVAAIKGEPHE